MIFIEIVLENFVLTRFLKVMWVFYQGRRNPCVVLVTWGSTAEATSISM